MKILKKYILIVSLTYVGLSFKTYVADSIIKPLLKADKLEYTNKRSINARNQKYITVKNKKFNGTTLKYI